MKKPGLGDRAFLCLGQASGFFQFERVVQRLHRQFHIFAVNQNRDLDLARADHLDVDALAGQHLEHLRRDAGVVLHAEPHDGDLRDRLVALRQNVFSFPKVSAPGPSGLRPDHLKDLLADMPRDTNEGVL